MALSPSSRPKAVLVAACFLVLLATGLRPDALPYPRYQSRYSDSVIAHWPGTYFLRQSVLERGQFPLWRETIMAGQPFAADPLYKTAYPLQWLVLIFPPTLHLNVLVVFHLFLAGAGMWVWAGALGLKPPGIALSALGYVLAPRLFGHLGAGHLDILYALAWWPWLMWSVRRVITEPHRPAHSVLLFAMLAALLLLADLRVSLFAFLSAGIYALTILLPNRLAPQTVQSAAPPLYAMERGVGGEDWNSVSRLAFGLLWTAVLTAALFLPLLAWQPYANRAGLTAADAGLLALEPLHFLGLLLPDYQSSVETLTYLGIPVLVLALIAVLSAPRRVRLLWLAALVLIVLYALGQSTPFWPLLVRLFPFLLWFRVPSRAWLLLALFIPLLAGHGLDILIARLERVTQGEPLARLARLRLLTVAGMVILAVLGLFALLVLPLPPAASLGTMVVSLALGVILLAALAGRLKPQTVAVLLLVITFVDLALTGYGRLSWRGADFWLDPYRPLAERLAQLNADRIYSPTYSLEQQAAEVYGLRLFGGIDPFQLRGVVAAVEQGGGVPITGYSVVLPPPLGAQGDDVSTANRDARPDTRILAEWGVSHLVAAYPLSDDRLELLDTINGVYLYANRDYRPRANNDEIPSWPAAWPDLPDAAAVRALNDLTLTAHLLSALGWLVTLLLYAFFTLRTKR